MGKTGTVVYTVHRRSVDGIDQKLGTRSRYVESAVTKLFPGGPRLPGDWREVLIQYRQRTRGGDVEVRVVCRRMMLT